MIYKLSKEEITAQEFHFNALKESTPKALESVRKILSENGFKEAFDTISSWTGYASTPIYNLCHLADDLGLGEIYYKDEGSRFSLKSFKALGGAYAVKKAIDINIGRLPSLGHISADLLNRVKAFTVASATDGNHGRSVAWGAKMFGCSCVIFIHEKVSEYREEQLKNLGAKVVRKGKNYDESVRIAQEVSSLNNWQVISDTSYEGYLDIPKYVMHGYEVMAHEAIKLQNMSPTHVFLQTGVGSMAAGVAANLYRGMRTPPKIILVDPQKADCWVKSIQKGKPVRAKGDLDTFMAGLACGEVSVLAWEILQNIAEAAISISDKNAAEMMRYLFMPPNEQTKVVAGESAVGGLVGLVASMNNNRLKKNLKLTRNSKILVFGTESDTDPEIFDSVIKNEIM